MSSGTERGVVMKTTPRATFEVVEADFPFQFLVVALDPPPQLHQPNQLFYRGGSWQRGELEL